MQFAAAFIEYLVPGCCGLLWLVPLLSSEPIKPGGFGEWEVALLLPLAYVLGMLVDFVSEKCVSPFKDRIRKKVGSPKREVSSSTVFIAWHSDELAREFQVRSSRDRHWCSSDLRLSVLPPGGVANTSPRDSRSAQWIQSASLQKERVKPVQTQCDCTSIKDGS